MNGDLKQTFVDFINVVSDKDVVAAALDSIGFNQKEFVVVSGYELDITGDKIQEGAYTVVPTSSLSFYKDDLGLVVRSAVESAVSILVQQMYDDGWRISRKDGTGQLNNDRVEVYDIEWIERCS